MLERASICQDDIRRRREAGSVETTTSRAPIVCRALSTTRCDTGRPCPVHKLEQPGRRGQPGHAALMRPRPSNRRGVPGAESVCDRACAMQPTPAELDALIDRFTPEIAARYA